MLLPSSPRYPTVTTTPRGIVLGRLVPGSRMPVTAYRLPGCPRGALTTEVMLAGMGVFPLLKSLLPVVVAFLLPTTDTLDHRRVGNGTHRHGLFQEPMEELPAMA